MRRNNAEQYDEPDLKPRGELCIVLVFKSDGGVSLIALHNGGFKLVIINGRWLPERQINMRELKHKLTISTPVQSAFDWFKNFDENYVKWHPIAHQQFKWLSDKPITKGSLF